MDTLFKGALTANAASMGLNWIYNIAYLEKLKKTEVITFIKPDPAKYKRARKAYFAYPNADIGDVSLQGSIAKWLYQALKDNPELTKEDYKTLILDNILPGGPYEGYIESYGKELIFNQLIDDLKLDHEKIEIDDDQLVGFVPYIVTKSLGLSNALANQLAKLFTLSDDYYAFYVIFDQVLEDIKSMSLKEALTKSLHEAPKHYGFKLTMALNVESKKDILEIVNTSCSIGYAIPLIYYILSHTNSYEEAVTLNTEFGGASCDRGMLIGAIYSQISDIPSDWLAKMKF
ncbi:MAG: ADP-ribosylglycohydrolase family protein [Candidatus Izemoplasmataceae bacterium]